MLKIDEMTAYYCIYMDFRKAFNVVTHRSEILKKIKCIHERIEKNKMKKIKYKKRIK